jgi:uncharacterized protein
LQDQYRRVPRLSHDNIATGQVRLPLLGPLVTRSCLPRRLAMGLHSYRGVPLFVSRGIGYSGLNVRLHCPAEVALLTLRASAVGVRAA